MSRRMLLGIRDRAERIPATKPTARPEREEVRG
jgi:hypothetical protein